MVHTMKITTMLLQLAARATSSRSPLFLLLEFQMHDYECTVKNHFCSSLLHTFLLYSTSFYPFTNIPLFYLFYHLVFNPLYV